MKQSTNKIIDSIIDGSMIYSKTKDKYFSIDKFPVTEKTTVINHKELFVTENKFDLKIIHSMTSGSSGEILDVEWYYNEFIRSLSYIWNERMNYGVHPYDNYCTCYSHFYGFGGYIFEPRMKIEKNCLYFSKHYLDDDSLLLYYKNIIEFKPKMLAFQPSFAYVFGNFILKNKYSLPDSIVLLELTGEMVTDEVFKELEKMFENVNITNLYGMQEFNGIGYSNNKYLRILDKNVIVEILDENGKICDDDQVGDIIVSTLMNSRMPLIKYKTKDRGRWKVINNEKRLEVVASRSNDYFHYNGLIYDGSLFFSLIASINCDINHLIKAFGVTHFSDKLEFQLIIDKCIKNKAALKQKINYKIKEYLEYKNIFIPIEIKFVESIEKNESSNKIKYFSEKY